MPGLLDIFNSYDGQQALGLLAAAGGRSDGAGFGQRLMEGLSQGDKWKAAQAAEKRAQMQEQMQQMQMQQMANQAKQQEAEMARRRTIEQGMGQFFKSGQPALSPLAGNSELGIQPSAGRAAIPPSFDAGGAAQFLAQNGAYEDALKFMPKPKELAVNKLDVKDFTPASVQKFAQTGNYGDLVRMDKAHFANIGGSTVAADPFTGRPLNSMINTQSPDSVAGNAVTMRGQNMTDARSRESNFIQQQAGRTQVMQTPEGLIAIDKGTNQAMPVTMAGAPIKSEDAMKKKANATSVLSLLDEADKLLPKSTGSLVGTGLDMAAGAVGYATKGAQAVAQLKAVEGQLIASMPRMEGPQSDSDRLLYQKAAGDLANPMAPIKTRQAASATIRKLQERYTGASGNSIDSLLEKYK